MGDTPRTDAEAFVETNPANAIVMATFARQLERETVTLQQRVDELGAALDSACVEMHSILARNPMNETAELVTLTATLNSCESVLLRHGIRTGDQVQAKP